MSAALFSPEAFADDGAGPLYLQLDAPDRARRSTAGALGPGESLPPEREMASLTGLSRVTVRKAVQALVQAGRLVQRRGSGTFVAPRVERVEQALSLLTSFSEDMARRGKSVRSVWLSRAVHAPSPEEMMALGLTAHDRVARLERVRLADERAAGDRARLAVDGDPARPGGGRGLALRGARRARAAAGPRGAAHLGGEPRGARRGAARGAGRARRGCGSSGSPTCRRGASSSSPGRSIAATPTILRPSCRSRPNSKEGRT